MPRVLKKRIKKSGRDAPSKKTPVKWLVVIAFFLCELLIYTGTRIECLQMRYRIASAMERHQKQEVYKKALVIEMERLSSPERISRIARTRLNFSMPDHDRIVYLTR